MGDKLSIDDLENRLLRGEPQEATIDQDGTIRDLKSEPTSTTGICFKVVGWCFGRGCSVHTPAHPGLPVERGFDENVACFLELEAPTGLKFWVEVLEEDFEKHVKPLHLAFRKSDETSA